MGSTAAQGSQSSTPNSKLIWISCRVNGVSAIALLDPGAAVTTIREDFIANLSGVTSMPTSQAIRAASGHAMIPSGKAPVEVHIDDHISTITALIVPTIPADILLGVDWCHQNRVTLNFAGGQLLTFPDDAAPTPAPAPPEEYQFPGEACATVSNITSSKAHLCLCQPLTIPPWSETIVQVSISPGLQGRTAIIQPNAILRNQTG